MPLLWSPTAQQFPSVSVSTASLYYGDTVNFLVSTQGFNNGNLIYYSTTGTAGVQTTGTAVVSNYLGDLGTATIPVTTTRTASTGSFVTNFYQGNASGNQILNYSFTSPLANPDPYFTATVLLLSPAGIGPTALTDLSGTTSTIQVVGPPNVRSFIPFTTPGISSSMFFNGSTDYLASPQATSLAFGTGNFTVECWMYFTGASTAGEYDIIEANPATGSFQLYISSASQGLKWGSYGGASYTIATVGNIPVNQWVHIAVSRAGTGANQTSAYLNGVLQTQQTDSFNYIGVGFGIGARNTGVQFFTGYLSNVRVVKGLAVYTGAFTPPTSPLQTTQSSGTNISAITTQTVLLLLQAPQPSDNNSFYNSESTLTQISYLGVPAKGTFSPFSQYATFFNGTTQYLTVPSNTVFSLGTGDFTLECWIYLNTSSTVNEKRILTNWGGASQSYQFYLRANNRLSWQIFTQNSPDVAALAITSFTWTHVAFSNVGGNIYTFINGVLQDTTGVTNSANGSGSNLAIGADNAGTLPWPGYISNLRFIKGQGLYTATFTPPPLTTRLSATINTILLVCRGPNTSDYSTFTNTVTTFGSIGTRPISTTTLLTSVYSTSTIGGSIYFTPADVLQIATNNTFVFGTGDFTIEAWIYPTSSSGGVILDTRSGSTGITPVFYIAAGQLTYYVNGTGVISSPITLSLNTWHHVALARSSGNTKMFLNGIQTGSTYADSNNFTLTHTNFIGGRDNSGGNSGFLYISNFRLIKGYAAYTGNFAPNITPAVAALTGTTVIINGNDSAVYDAAGYHNIATTGTATITTSPIKFGSSSIKISPGAGLNITTSTGSLLQFGTNPFTIEAWIQGRSNTQQKVIFDNRNPNTAGAGFDFYLNTSNILLFGTAGTTYITGSTVLTNGLWYHVALVRESATVIKMYLNGNQEGSTYTSSQNFTNYLTRIGFGINGTFDGFISDLRVTRYARYTAAFPTTTATTYSQLM